MSPGRGGPSLVSARSTAVLGSGRPEVDVVVVGSGPNGLAAAVTMARAGLSVRVLEAERTAGGGARTIPLGLADGVVHDLCSAVHPLAWASPFFREFDLAARGVELLVPEASYAQALRIGSTSRGIVAYRDLERTVEGLGRDGPGWRRLLEPWSDADGRAAALVLADHRVGLLTQSLWRRGIGAMLCGIAGQGSGLSTGTSLGEDAAALFSGVAAHAGVAPPSLVAAATGLLLAGLAHGEGGWPIPRGGSGELTRALLMDLSEHGGQVQLDTRVCAASDLPPACAYLFDTAPGTLLNVLADRLPWRARYGLRSFRHGAAVAKVDLVIQGPVPWSAAGLADAGTVHIGGTRAEVARAESAVAAGRHAAEPVVLVSDPARVDLSRRVAGLRPLWAYMQVPAGSPLDPVETVLRRIEQHAPGFRDTVVGAVGTSAAQMSRHNENYVGGDIATGAMSLRQTWWRPSPLLASHTTGLPGVALCSAASGPGPGVHGLAGWYAAQRVLAERFGLPLPTLSPEQGTSPQI